MVLDMLDADHVWPGTPSSSEVYQAAKWPGIRPCIVSPRFVLGARIHIAGNTANTLLYKKFYAHSGLLYTATKKLQKPHPSANA
jgi:hypothetical protein